MAVAIIQNYDFEQFRTRFKAMSDKELVAEYANVCNRIQEMENLHSSGNCSFDELSTFLDDAVMVQNFIAGYLAGLFIQEHGYFYTSDDKFFPCGT